MIINIKASTKEGNILYNKSWRGEFSNPSEKLYGGNQATIQRADVHMGDYTTELVRTLDRYFDIGREMTT